MAIKSIIDIAAICAGTIICGPVSNAHATIWAMEVGQTRTYIRTNGNDLSWNNARYWNVFRI